MRLTLRTLLCYLDDVLEPEDAQEIAKKIEESEFASGLVHRIRGSMRKLRLGAPKLDGKGVGLDANTVAEYLDSTLASDRVPDFEKICLESDLHLAEVASCHQILTLVLGEPAEITPELRERMYQIPDEAVRPRQTSTSGESRESTAAAGATEMASAAAETATTAPKSEQPREDATNKPADDTASDVVDDESAPPSHEVPDYLKAGEKKRVPIVATVLLLFLVLSIAVFAIGPKNIASWFGGSNKDDNAVANAQGENDNTSNGETPASQESKSKAGTPDLGKQDDVDNETTKPDLADSSAKGSQTPGSADNGSKATTNAQVDNDQPMSKEDTPIVAKELDADGKTDASGKPKNDVEPVNDKDKDKTASTDLIKPGTPESIDEPPKTAEPVAVDVGRYVSEDQILARLDPESGAWLRLAANEQLASKDHLLVLPTFRPQIAFSSGLQLTIVGPAAGSLTQPSDEGVPGLELDYGKAMALTVSKPNTQLQVNLAGIRGTITFVQADSSVAFEVIRYLPPGSDPATAEAQRIVQVFVPRAEVHWRPEKGEPESLSENEILVLADGKKTRGTLKVLPAWLEPSEARGIEEIASEGLEQEIPEDRSLMLSLEESIRDNRVEVRMLAGRCLTYLDNFDAFVTMLSDKNNKSFWHKHLDAVRQGLARGPESAKALRTAFERIRGDKAGELYRLVWGYNSGQLATGADAQLVDYLSHEDLDFRVLAFENLRRITGKIGSYRPEVREIERAPKINYWRERLDAGEIVFRSPPVPPTLIPIE